MFSHNKVIVYLFFFAASLYYNLFSLRMTKECFSWLLFLVFVIRLLFTYLAIFFLCFHCFFLFYFGLFFNYAVTQQVSVAFIYFVFTEYFLQVFREFQPLTVMKTYSKLNWTYTKWYRRLTAWISFREALTGPMIRHLVQYLRQ